MNVSTVNRPAIYFDTTVLLDVIDNRRESTHMLLETAREHGFQITASPFGILEMIEAKKTDRWAESMLERGYTVVQISRRMGSRRSGPLALTSDQIADVYNAIREALQGELDIVGFPEPTPGLMNHAEDICASTTLAAADSLHLATALYFGCQLIVSSDSDLLRTARQYIHATPPEGFRNAIANLT